MGRPVAGLWSAIEDNSEVWRYITVNGLIFQHGVRDNMVCWDRLRVPAAARSGIAALMGLSGGRLNPDDETMWDAAVAELGGLPDMVRCGYGELSERDMERGWKLDQYGGCYRVVDDDAECLAGFLGCAADEVDDVIAAVDAIAEPEPVTAEIPEIPPHVNTDAKVVRVSPNVIPVGMAAKDYKPFQVFKRRPRGFKDAQGRKRVYVCFTDADCVVAVRDGYEWGADPVLEREVSEYLSRYGWTLAA